MPRDHNSSEYQAIIGTLSAHHGTRNDINIQPTSEDTIMNLFMAGIENATNTTIPDW